MVDLDALTSKLGFVLKPEQKDAVESLLRGKDVFGVLPTDFGKSLIYQLFVVEEPNANNFLAAHNNCNLPTQEHYRRADNFQ